MPFIAWFVGAITQFAAYLTTYLGQRWAVRTAVLAGLVALTAAFTAGLAGLVAGIQLATVDNSWFKYGLSLMPSNTIPCISAYISAAVMRYIYDKQYSFYSRWMDGGGF